MDTDVVLPCSRISRLSLTFVLSRESESAAGRLVYDTNRMASARAPTSISEVPEPLRYGWVGFFGGRRKGRGAAATRTGQNGAQERMRVLL